VAQGRYLRCNRGSLKGWILQITRNRALNELRNRRVRPTGGGVVEGDEVEALAAIADEHASPDEAQWAAHRRATLQKAIDALPAAEKRALSLAFFEELTHEQVALALRVPLGTAKTRIRRAMKRLAPAVLAMIAAIAIAIAWRREGREQARAEVEQRALRLVTASDVVPVRLEASPGALPGAHGTYRAKPGTDIAVITASNIPAPGAGQRTVAWVRHGERWWFVGILEPGDEAERSLLIAHDPAVASPVDEVRVSHEAASETSAPHGPTLLRWSASQ
jgi:RNA polymerase sigma-70 factor (ECF subfamily)